MLGDNGYEAAEIAATMRAALLTIDQQNSYRERLADLKEAALATTFVGTPEQISEALGQFHFMKGKIEAYEEILNDHFETAEQLAASQQQPQ